jgi:hypothetical protein
MPPKVQRMLIATLRSQRDEAKKEAEEKETLYLQEQQNHQSTIVLYQQVEARNNELQLQYNEAVAQTTHYMTLYQKTLNELQFERRSKAGIKGWETRRKRENERLKQEIGEMAVLLRDSIARKDEAISHLDELAERMDRIHNLVDSVEGDSASNPVGLFQKLQRIWRAIKEILEE